MDDDLSARLRLGDPAALEEAMDRYASYAAKIIAAYLNRTLPPEDMEEVLSDVFVSLWNSRERLKGEVKPYLAAIARNAARQKLRQFRPMEALPEDRELADEAPQPEQRAETAERDASLHQAIGALPPGGPGAVHPLLLPGTDGGGDQRRHGTKSLHPAGPAPPGPEKAEAIFVGKGCLR